MPTTSAAAGPNGAEAWFNRGIDANGWDPPVLNVNNLVAIAPEVFLQKFPAMQPYAGMVKAGLAYNHLPTTPTFITLAFAIAMEESGGKKKLPRTDLVDYLGRERLNLNDAVIMAVLRTLREAMDAWQSLLTRSFLSPEMRERYVALLRSRAALLEIL